MRALSRSLALLLLVSGLSSAQGVPGALVPCRMDGSDCAPATGTVTTTGTLASGQVALGSGATSITGDAGLTGVGTGTGFKLGIGTDVFLSRASAGTLLVEDGSGAARDVQARKLLFYNLGGIGATDYEAGSLGFAANVLTLSTSYGGTGNSRQIMLYAPGAAISLISGSINTSGVLYPGTNNTDDIGLPGAPLVYRSGYFGTSLISPLYTSGPGKSGTNVAGTNNTIQAEPGTGSATGSSLIFQTPSATTSGTTAQAQATRLTLSEPAVIAAVPVRLAGYTVATLPAGTVGDTAYVTDATAPTYLGALTGGGAVTCPVMYNGSAWVSH